MLSGTPQNGWNTTVLISSEKTGVWVSILPVMTRSEWMTLPSFTTRTVNSGMLTHT